MTRKPKLCETCGGSAEVAIRPTQTIDATYPENDKWKGDEHLAACPLCSRSPWDFAKGTGKILVTSVFGPILAVYYPHRRTADCYVAGPDGVIKCCQTGCEKEFPAGELNDHIDLHDTRKTSQVKKKILMVR